MRTREEQRELLERLISVAKSGGAAGETEWLEMKTNISESHASITYDRVGEYISGLSNGACVHYKDFGYLVLGVQDETWEIVGTNLRMKEARYRGQDYELWLRNNVDPRIVHFNIEEFDWDEARHIVIFEIPAAQAVPTSFKDVEYIRIGSNLTKLKNFPEYIRQIYNSNYDWSADIVRDATIADLDTEAICVARERYADKHPHLAEEMKGWTDEVFLDKAKITRNSKVTNAAIVLLGKPESESMISPAQTRIKWILKDSKGMDRDYAIECCPMVLSVETIYKHIRNLTYRRINPAKRTLNTDEMLTYEPYVLREAMYNAIAHQDYMQHGVVNVVEYEDKIVISNLGTFIPGSLKAVLSKSGPQERYHNPFLVGAMVELRLVDTIGSGIPKICGFQRERFFPMPVYELEDGRVSVTIHGRVVNEQYAWQLASRPSLTLPEMEMLNRVQLNQPISDEELSYMRKQKMVGGKSGNPRIIGQIEKKDDVYIRLIEDLLQKGEMSKSDIQQGIAGQLPEDLTDAQKYDKIAYLLKRMKNDGLVESKGKGVSAMWFIIR